MIVIKSIIDSLYELYLLSINIFNTQNAERPNQIPGINVIEKIGKVDKISNPITHFLLIIKMKLNNIYQYKIANFWPMISKIPHELCALISKKGIVIPEMKRKLHASKIAI